MYTIFIQPDAEETFSVLSQAGLVVYKYLIWVVLAISKFYFLSIAFILRPRSTKDKNTTYFDCERET